ncbi:MAG: hypothetical protein K0R38_2119 [Polyangiaceae bacterium]|nr:hypothetical protein [Polyangiaceae bacterium]
MVKRTGSKSSRSGRRAGKERVERARERGLPERRQEPLRVRAATPEPRSSTRGEARSSDAPSAPAAASAGVPPWVWVAGIALALLAGAYFLSRQRDQALTEARPEPAPTSNASALQSTDPTPSAPTDAPSAAAAPSALPPLEAVRAEAEPTPSEPPAVPSVASAARPKVSKPVAPPPTPVVVAPAPTAIAKPAPVVVPPVAAPPPVAEPAAKPKPADNPY